MTVVMGVLNVTPDSFSDGGCYLDPAAAVAHGRELAEQGADLVDVGGESTRPGAARPDPTDELRRVIPVIEQLVAAGVPVSVDTMRATVARAAVAAGATMINDVSGGLADPQMADVVAGNEVGYVVMHWRGHSQDMYHHARYDDVAADVARELAQRVRCLQAHGVRREQLVLDPGFGFAKAAEHNWALLAHLRGLRDLGLPLLVGTSRKSFLGRVGVAADAPPRPPEERDAATVATTVLAVQAGAWGVRVHDVRSTADALAVLDAVQAAT